MISNCQQPDFIKRTVYSLNSLGISLRTERTYLSLRMEKEKDQIEKLVREYLASETFIKMVIAKTKQHIVNKARYEKDPIPEETLEKLVSHLKELKIKENNPKKAFLYLDMLSTILWNNHGINKKSRALKKELELLSQFEVKIAGNDRKNAVFLVGE